MEAMPYVFPRDVDERPVAVTGALAGRLPRYGLVPFTVMRQSTGLLFNRTWHATPRAQPRPPEPEARPSQEPPSGNPSKGRINLHARSLVAESNRYEDARCRWSAGRLPLAGVAV